MSSLKKLKHLALLLVALMFMQTAWAQEFDANGNPIAPTPTGGDGEDPCAGEEPTVDANGQPISPEAQGTALNACRQAELFEKAGHAQVAASITYGVITTVCTTACIISATGAKTEAEAQHVYYWTQGCRFGSLAGPAADMVGQMFVGAAGETIVGQMSTTMGAVFGGQNAGFGNAADQQNNDLQTADKNLGLAAESQSSAAERFNTERARLDAIDARAKAAQASDLEPANAEYIQAQKDLGTAQPRFEDCEANKPPCADDKGKAANFPTLKANYEAAKKAFEEAGRKVEAAEAKIAKINEEKKNNSLVQDKATLDEANKKLDVTKGEAKEAKSKSVFDPASCMASITNAMQTGVRIYNATESYKKADESKKIAGALRPPKPPSVKTQALTAGSGGSKNTTSGPGPVEGAPRIKADVIKGKPTPEAIIAQVAATEGVAPLLKQLGDNGFNVRDAVQKTIDGAPPLAAFAASAGSGISDEAKQALSELSATSTANAAQFRDQFDAADKKSGISQNAFDSFSSSGGGGGRRVAGKGDGGGLDLAGLMAQLMPKKAGKEAGPKGPEALKLGAGTQKGVSEGFHPPERSIFDIVDTRYQLVSRRFLEGGTVVQGTGSILPANPYLRK